MHPRRLRLASLLLAWVCAWGTPAYAEDLWPDLSKPPAAQGGGERDAALIVGIEDYDKVADVPGAERNAKAWYLYLTQTRKLPVESVRLLKNDEATLDALQREAQTARQRVKPGGTLWVIFIGHGAPSKDGKDGLLVGADARQNPDSIYERSLRVGWRPALGDERQSLLDLLQGGPQEHTTLILDTCFSGQTQADRPLVAGLQPLIPVHAQTAPAPALTIFTATSSQEFAGPLPGVSLPAFSYLLLGALRGWGDEDRDGQVTHAEALAYTRRTLSAVLKGRSQTPELKSADPDRVVSKPRGAERAPDLAKVVLHDAPTSDPGKANRDAAPATPAHAVNASTNPPDKPSKPAAKLGALSKRPTSNEAWTPSDPGLEIVEFSSKPPGAAVMLDGKPLCASTPCARELPPGTYLVSMSDPCREAQEAPVELRAGRMARVAWTLKPKPAGLEVRAYDPQGNALKAKVYVDGAEVGQTPGTFSVSACAQQVEVKAAGHEPFQAELSLRERDTSRIQARLTPAPKDEPEATPTPAPKVAKAKPAPKPKPTPKPKVAKAKPAPKPKPATKAKPAAKPKAELAVADLTPAQRPDLAPTQATDEPSLQAPSAPSLAPDALAPDALAPDAFVPDEAEPAPSEPPKPARFEHGYAAGQTLTFSSAEYGEVQGVEFYLARVWEVTTTGGAPALLLALEDPNASRADLAYGLALYTPDLSEPSFLGFASLLGVFDLDRDGISELHLYTSETTPTGTLHSQGVISFNEDNPRVFFEAQYEDTVNAEGQSVQHRVELHFQDLNDDGKLDILENAMRIEGDEIQRDLRRHITE